MSTHSSKRSSIQHHRRPQEEPDFYHLKVEPIRKDEIFSTLQKKLRSVDKEILDMAKVHQDALKGRFVFYDQKSTASWQYKDYLEAEGVRSIYFVDSERELFELLRTVPVHLLGFWYGRDKVNHINLIQQVVEVRDIPRVPIVLTVPSEEVAEIVRHQYPDILVDDIWVFPESRTEFFELITQCQVRMQEVQGVRWLVEQMRFMSRQQQESGTKKPWFVEINDEGSISVVEALSRLEKKEPQYLFWLSAEKIIYCMFHGKLATAEKILAAIEKKYSHRLLFLLLKASIIRVREGTVVAEKWLLTQVQKSKDFNTESAFRVGNLLCRWGNISALKVFLDYWYRQPRWQQDHRFISIVGQYAYMVGDDDRAETFLKYVVREHPYNAPYIVKLASLFNRKKYFYDAERLLIFVRQLPKWQRQEFWEYEGLFHAYLGQRKVRKAERILSYLMKTYAHKPQINDLRKIYESERQYLTELEDVNEDPLQKGA